ncbi:hypothetical protein RJ641_035243 [Dillenia turbinata]|uniref:Cupin type-2 domain-containing protein n=2 Tax=Magnoliopsida TaxID=3398 RepID=A0AAN8ZIB9_9MAGN
MPPYPSSLRLHTLLLSFLSLCLFTITLANEGFCSASSFSTDTKPLYYKVSNPTLSPSHLKDLPGYTRSVYKRDHAFITPESHVFSPLPDWTNTLGAYLISPAMGSHFVMYLARMQGNSRSGLLPPNDVERFIFVLHGTVALTNVSGSSHKLTVSFDRHLILFNGSGDAREAAIACLNLACLSCFHQTSFVLEKIWCPEPETKLFMALLVNLWALLGIYWNLSDQDLNSDGLTSHWRNVVDSFAYLPPSHQHLIASDAAATLAIFERRHAYLEGYKTELIVGSTDAQPLLETPGEVFELRKLLPADLQYDFNIHIMDFQPGEFLNVKEVHYNQHGLLLLEGQGIYRLGDSWYPIQAGDAIWMAPFVPQWYAALGKTRSRYLLYKDVNRNPL